MTTDQSADLNWVAQQYVLGELDSDAAEAFEARLADEEAAGVALADAVQLMAALRVAAPVPARSASGVWRRLAWGVSATAAAGAAVWLLPRTATDVLDREVAVAGPQRAVELVSRWREALPEPAATPERWSDDDLETADDVPNWMLAAVSLEIEGSDEIPVQEN